MPSVGQINERVKDYSQQQGSEMKARERTLSFHNSHHVSQICMSTIFQVYVCCSGITIINNVFFL